MIDRVAANTYGRLKTVISPHVNAMPTVMQSLSPYRLIGDVCSEPKSRGPANFASI